MNGIARCPRCNRADAPTKQGRYRLHTMERRRADTGYCPMSELPVPVAGNSEMAFDRRADVVAELAFRLQEADPSTVWDYLTAVKDDELQRLLLVALAAIDVDKTVGELWGWVSDLPAARCSA